MTLDKEKLAFMGVLDPITPGTVASALALRARTVIIFDRQYPVTPGRKAAQGIYNAAWEKEDSIRCEVPISGYTGDSCHQGDNL